MAHATLLQKFNDVDGEGGPFVAFQDTLEGHAL
jgi:hypothetical protein